MKEALKVAEKLQRGAGSESLNYDDGGITPDLLFPEDIAFWHHPPNKILLQIHNNE